MISRPTRSAIGLTFAFLALVLPLQVAASVQNGTATPATEQRVSADSVLVAKDIEGSTVDLGDGSMLSGSGSRGPRRDRLPGSATGVWR